MGFLVDLRQHYYSKLNNKYLYYYEASNVKLDEKFSNKSILLYF